MAVVLHEALQPTRMTAPVPLAHLMAEAEAAPLTEPVAWTTRLRVLERAAPSSALVGATGSLAAALAERLRTRARGVNEELLRHVRDRAWFPDGRSPVSLTDHVASLATRYLAVNGREVALRTDVEDAPWDDGGSRDMTSRALRWRWLSLALPADLILAACSAAAGYDDPPGEHVGLATPLLEKVLAAGCAETHLHVGASVPFDRLWTAWMIEPPAAIVLAPDAPFGGRTTLEAMLSAASVARLAMGWFLAVPGPWASDTFTGFFHDHLDRFIRDRSWHRDSARMREVILAASGRIVGRPVTHGTPAYRQVLDRVCPRTAAQRHLDIDRADPLARWLPTTPGVGMPETRLATRAMRYLLGPGRRDRDFDELFWQYQRVRTRMFRYLVEEPGTAGLDWFSRHFRRIGPLRRPLERSKYGHALRVQSQGLHLAALEARTSPAKDWVDVRDELRSVATQALVHMDRSLAEGTRAPEVGLILHFVKSATCELRRRGGSLSNADPAHSSRGTRFAHWYRGREREAQAIATTLRRHPELLVLLRGIDVASKEVATPTWVLAPLFARVREASESAARVLSVRQPRWLVPPLRVTVHAGEDYRRLMEGLRRMHECVEAGLLRTGDRVGHGLALGLDVERYARVSPCVLQPAEERLDDLLWEFDRYRLGHCDAPSARCEYVRAQIDRLGRFVYDGAAPSIEALVDARRLRHRPDALEFIDYPRCADRQDRRTALEFSLLYTYLTDRGVYARGQREVEVHITPGELRALADAQGFLQRVLAKLEVTIECNPTSNLLIGDLGDLASHPAFRLVPLEDATPRFGVPVSINTDNPVTFGSCLGDEFALLHHALLSRGGGATAALAWIDAAREAGMRSRFTVAASAERAVLEALRGPTST